MVGDGETIAGTDGDGEAPPDGDPPSVTLGTTDPRLTEGDGVALPQPASRRA
jgi:hypothetical protein